MAQTGRKYDLILLGATGYTGQYTAEHITRHWPTNFKWAVAGRSHDKLSKVVQKLKVINADRLEPSVEAVQLDRDELHALAKRAKLIITTVGPYHVMGEPVLEACCSNGTHYLDVTGEVPWTVEMTKKYHEKAKANGVIAIPQCGIESSPADMLSFALATELNNSASLKTRELVYAVRRFNGTPSGGTMASVFTILDDYSLLDLARASHPSSMCPVNTSQYSQNRPFLSRLLGYRYEPALGTLTTSLNGPPDIPVVMRSWGLLNSGKTYGPNFMFRPYILAKNAVAGIITHFIVSALPLILALRPVRWILRSLVFQPGQGPTPEQAAKEEIEAFAVALADGQSKKKAWGHIQWKGSMYGFTAVLVSEAAATILNEQDISAKGLGGGVLTPATLGLPYIDRLIRAGTMFETKVLDD